LINNGVAIQVQGAADLPGCRSGLKLAKPVLESFYFLPQLAD
jgi:hypothetical protein